MAKLFLVITITTLLCRCVVKGDGTKGFLSVPGTVEAFLGSRVRVVWTVKLEYQNYSSMYITYKRNNPRDSPMLWHNGYFYGGVFGDGDVSGLRENIKEVGFVIHSVDDSYTEGEFNISLSYIGNYKISSTARIVIVTTTAKTTTAGTTKATTEEKQTTDEFTTFRPSPVDDEFSTLIAETSKGVLKDDTPKEGIMDLPLAYRIIVFGTFIILVVLASTGIIFTIMRCRKATPKNNQQAAEVRSVQQPSPTGSTSIGRICSGTYDDINEMSLAYDYIDQQEVAKCIARTEQVAEVTTSKYQHLQVPTCEGATASIDMKSDRVADSPSVTFSKVTTPEVPPRAWQKINHYVPGTSEVARYDEDEYLMPNATQNNGWEPQVHQNDTYGLLADAKSGGNGSKCSLNDFIGISERKKLEQYITAPGIANKTSRW